MQNHLLFEVPENVRSKNGASQKGDEDRLGNSFSFGAGKRGRIGRWRAHQPDVGYIFAARLVPIGDWVIEKEKTFGWLPEANKEG